MKKLQDIAWNVSEETYRQDKALSYSILARYEKAGFSSIPHLFDKQEGEALTFGSMVDCLMTEGKEVFDTKFAIVNYVPTESVAKVVQYLVNTQSEEYLNDISDITIGAVCNVCEYQPKWKVETKVAKIRSEGTNYYNQLKKAKGKTIVSSKAYTEVLDTVNTLYNHTYIGKYFKKPSGNKEILFQTKFKTTLSGIWVRCMFDGLMIDYNNKVIIPFDLKTTSLPEYEFAKKYLENRYDIQSRLYWAILRQVMNNDKYFKDFELCSFRFVVINKDRLQPLVFNDGNSLVQNKDIELKFKSGRITTLRDPITIAIELFNYLDWNSQVPSSIRTDALNSLDVELQKLQ